jgi:hypothetical protein
VQKRRFLNDDHTCGANRGRLAERDARGLGETGRGGAEGELVGEVEGRERGGRQRAAVELAVDLAGLLLDHAHGLRGLDLLGTVADLHGLLGQELQTDRGDQRQDDDAHHDAVNILFQR